mgnify:CR=1 FL=1
MGYAWRWAGGINMTLWAVTLKAYGMTQTRYVEAETATDAHCIADGMTSIGRVVAVRRVERDQEQEDRT